MNVWLSPPLRFISRSIELDDESDTDVVLVSNAGASPPRLDTTSPVCGEQFARLADGVLVQCVRPRGHDHAHHAHHWEPDR